MPTQPRTAGERVDLAEFAHWRWWMGTEKHDLQAHEITHNAEGFPEMERDPETGEWQLGLEWSEPRDIRQVAVQFAGGRRPPGLRVQYWRLNWPTIAPERLPGARRGWIGRDDPWHGRWVTALGEWTQVGPTSTLTVDPLDLPELGREAAEALNNAEHYRAPFRRTLKIRLVCRGEERPQLVSLQAFSGATWQEGNVLVRFGLGQGEAFDWSGWAEATNGCILDAQALTPTTVQPPSPTGWCCPEEVQTKGVALCILYTRCARESSDNTIITLRTQARTFSFRVADLEDGPIYIPDYGALISWAQTVPDLAALQARIASAPRPIYDRVEAEPEHSLARAMAEIPPLDVTKQAPFGRYLPLGIEAGRQQFALRYNGELFGDKQALKLQGRDAARLQWPGSQLRFCFGSGDPPDFREGRREGTRQQLLNGWLPIVISTWTDREIEYEQTAFGALLDSPMTGPDARRGDEDTVTMMRLRLRNTTPGAKLARLWLAVAPQEALRVQEGVVVTLGRVVPAVPVAREWRVAPYEAPCLRCTIDTRGHGSLVAVPYAPAEETSRSIPTAVLYEVELQGGEAQTIDLVFPLPSLTNPADWQRVAALNYEEKLEDVVRYWCGWVETGGQFQAPDAALSDFHKAARTHVAISADKDPTTGLITIPAASWSYGACGNEACWQITMFDQAGHHDRAASYLETFLQTQGLNMPDGYFGSAVGAFQGLNIDGLDPAGQIAINRTFGYNLDHGVIMECLADHYRYSGDRAWLERVAPRLVAACDFVIRERARTQVEGPDGAPDQAWGLLPAGHLEDNPEWRHWFAVNAHAYRGLRDIAAVLGEIGHTEAGRLAEEAAAYREDIRRAARRAMEEAPVMRLLDGTYVPHIPTRTHLRGREWGWFREAAYGALHLLEGEVFDAHEEEMTWLLKDLEDNLYVSREWGRPVDLERYWFSHGGITIQPNLTDLAIDYLRRGQVKHGLRALFNNFGASLYPDVRTFTEHPVIELGHGVGPFYKSSDEAKALVWLRAFLLREEGQALWIAPGAPRTWFAPGQSFGVQRAATFFGPVSYEVQATEEGVSVQLDLDPRRAPAEIRLWVRRPNAPAMMRVTVNGEEHTDFDAEAECIHVATPPVHLRAKVD